LHIEKSAVSQYIKKKRGNNVEFSENVLNEIAKYKKLNDIHDRIIVATANLIGAGLITNDSEIKNSSYVKIIW